ncbi:hypothetical protein PN36_11175 [Candidatus Thiomargarita nelsonii]|uniref:Uncharacterized protein n=1 Tax=Candidatus Thiomargarita nelsonii TaxID=1003181 RepID=A0A0A6RR38_9GAMM|nr:hypothetical protein PN36_11175 [Candidatus Thiomargarita nelsonii]
MKTFIKKFFPIERTISQEKGDFKLFALFERKDIQGIWDVVLAADWLPGEEMKSLRYVFGKIRAVLDKNEFIQVSKVVLLDVNEPFIEELQDFLEDYHNPSVFSDAVINGMSFKTGYIIVSPLNSTEPA